MKITIENQTYNLDIHRAKSLGVLTEEKNFKSGDIFSNGISKILILDVFWENSSHKRRYQIFGVGSSLQAFSDSENLFTKQEMLDYLRNRSHQFVKNIKTQSKALFK